MGFKGDVVQWKRKNGTERKRRMHKKILVRKEVTICIGAASISFPEESKTFHLSENHFHFITINSQFYLDKIRRLGEKKKTKRNFFIIKTLFTI